MGSNKKGTWLGAFGSLFASILMVLTVRWLLIEAYVIPSGSMLPTLQIADHIFVNKLAFGVRLPFSSRWILRYRQVERGQIVVFRSVNDSETFFIKRIVGIAGDEIDYKENGELWINGQAVPQVVVEDPEAVARANGFQWDEDMTLFREKIGGRSFFSMIYTESDGHFSYKGKVPKGQFFVMGDNRDNSSDSRIWGFVPEENLLGTPVFIWLSCNSKEVHAIAQCDPQDVRWDRFGKTVK